MSIGAKGYVKLTLNIRTETKKQSEITGLEEGRYELYCVCAKHSSYITHLDFSEGKEAAFKRSSELEERRKTPDPQPKATKEEIGRVYGGMHVYNGDLEKFKTELDGNKEN